MGSQPFLRHWWTDWPNGWLTRETPNWTHIPPVLIFHSHQPKIKKKKGMGKKMTSGKICWLKTACTCFPSQNTTKNASKNIFFLIRKSKSLLVHERKKVLRAKFWKTENSWMDFLSQKAENQFDLHQEILNRLRNDQQQVPLEVGLNGVAEINWVGWKSIF